MNYNDIKNLNISKRGKKELLNALNKGGGSGAGVTIVDSVDKLDENAPVGSMAIVTGVSTGAVECTYDQLYQLSQEDLLIDQENMTVTFLHPEKLNQITGINIKMPKDTTIIPNKKQCRFIIGNFEFFNIALGTGDPNENTYGCMIASMVDSDGNIIDIRTMVMNKGVQNEYIIISVQDNNYVLNEESLNNFYANFNSISQPMFYFCEMMSLIGIGDSSSMTYINDFVTFYSGIAANSKIFIKDDKWKDAINDKIDAIKLNIENVSNKLEQSKADIIKIIDWGFYTDLLPNTYYRIHYGNYDLTLNLANYYDDNYKEYMFEIHSSHTTTIKFADEDDNELSIKWVDGEPPTLVADSTCLISILNGIGVYVII